MSNQHDFLTTSTKLFRYYKQLADQSMSVLQDAELHTRPSNMSNNIAILVKHMAGNMRSRFTDFLSTDGEKPWRDREGEFVDSYNSRAELEADWESGWTCLFAALSTLQEAQLGQTVYIRNEGHTALEAISRQLAHYSYHVGQIVYIAKAVKDTGWVSLSIPPGGTAAFNKKKFDGGPRDKFFTDPTK